MNLPEWLLQISALLALAVLLGGLAPRLRLPLTVILALVGFLALWLGRPFGIVSPLHGEEFEEVVVFIFLPVLVFEAAQGLNNRAFFRNLIPILTLAVPALAASAALIGYALHWGLGIPLISALLFGALISATDPVAVVAVFRKLGVPRRLLTLVEGESLLNDGVAIVLFSILLTAALGGEIEVAEGLVDFLVVFFGGAGLGLVLGFLAALVLPWLDKLPAAALSVALAYGGFVLADHVLGFSGVMATVAAGLTVGTLMPSRADEGVRELWHGLWEALGYVANALLFLLIGLSIDPELIGRNAGAIILAILVVFLVRPLVIVPLITVVQRLAGIPPVGLRNQAVMVWGGLRGGVALALALALPDTLPERDLFVAMTGGVVLATLLVNATTIGALVRRLGLDRPSRADRFLAGGARLAGINAARRRLQDLGLEDPVVEAELDGAEKEARALLAGMKLTPRQELEVVTRRGLHVERDTYQRLSDAGLLPPSVTRTLLHEVDDQIEEVSLDRVSLNQLRRRPRPVFDRFMEWLLSRLPKPVGEEASELVYAEASARWLAAKRTGEALELFKQLPNISQRAVEGARETFSRWEQEAVESLGELDGDAKQEYRELRQRQAEELARVASSENLESLAAVGLLPARVAEQAADRVVAQVADRTDNRGFEDKVTG